MCTMSFYKDASSTQRLVYSRRRYGGRDLPIRHLPPVRIPRGDGPQQGTELPDVPAPKRNGRPPSCGHHGPQRTDAAPHALSLGIPINGQCIVANSCLCRFPCSNYVQPSFRVCFVLSSMIQTIQQLIIIIIINNKNHLKRNSNLVLLTIVQHTHPHTRHPHISLSLLMLVLVVRSPSNRETCLLNLLPWLATSTEPVRQKEQPRWPELDLHAGARVRRSCQLRCP